MTKHAIRLTAVALAMSTATAMMAVPAKRGVSAVTTPDGTTLRVGLRGDENYHQYFTEDGYPLAERGGEFFYCDITASGDLVESGIRATDIDVRPEEAKAFLRGIDTAGLEDRVVARASRARQERDARQTPLRTRRNTDPEGSTPYPQGYGLFPDSRGSKFPAYGDQRALVILVEYQDVPFTLDDPADYFGRMLNEEGFADYGATGCAAEYFRLNSGDSFRPVFDVYGPVKLPHNRSYYGANDSWGNDVRPEQMVIEALDQLDPDVDFAQYDRDGDGLIDNVFIFYAGTGEASTREPDTVWPHANNLSKLNESGHIYDGVEADHYGCTNEWVGTRPDGVGTFVHEFGHVLGLPDIYSTIYSNAFTPDSWSVMDYGSYNNDGMTPPLYGAFERYALGWMAPRPIDRAVSALLPPMEDNVAGIIHTEKDTEFFLVENRQQSGWDTYIPGHGMLVWHIDYNELIWNNNAVNNVGSHQYVDLEEADGKRTETTRAGDAFPGTDGITSFTAQTTPSMTTWNGVPIDLPVTDIEETADGMIRFNVLGGNAAELPTVVLNDATDVAADAFTLSWTPAEGYDHLVSVYTREGDGTVVYVPGFRTRNCGPAAQVRVGGLSPETTYYFTVMASDGWTPGEASDEKNVTTTRFNISYYAVTASPATDVTSSGFTANWEALPDAVSYLVSVSRMVAGDAMTETCDFTDGVTSLPEGWESTSTKSYGMSTYSGVAAPSLRMGRNGDMLTSPVYEEGISSVTFWMRANGTDAAARVAVDGLCGEEWTEIGAHDVETAAGGKTVSQDIPDGVTRVRLRFDNPSDKGAVAIDDVTVAYGIQYSYEPLAAYSPADAGNALSLEITGLAPQTEYVYTVAATDGEFTSKASEAIHVRTNHTGGVDGIYDGMRIRMHGQTVTAPGARIEIYDMTGRLLATAKETVRLPGAGIYIVKLPETGTTFKYICN